MRRKKIKTSKKVSRWIFLIIVLAVAGHFGWKALTEFNKLNLNREAVYIEGNSMVSDNKILTQLDDVLKKNILDIDTAELENKLKNFSRIKSVRVKRHFPDGLRITVEEVIPVGYTMKDGRRFVVTAHGEIFEGPEGPPVKFIVTQKDAISRIVGLLDIIKKTDEGFFPLVEAVDINYKDDTIIHLTEGWFMKLPSADVISEEMVASYLDMAEKIKDKYSDRRKDFNYMDFRFIDFNAENIKGAIILK